MMLTEAREARGEGVEGEEGEEGEAEPWYWAAWEKTIEEFNLEQTLKVRLEGERVNGGEAAVRASFHKHAWPAYPLEPDSYADEAAYDAAVLAFRRICLAYTILKDPERRRIYVTCGFERLRQSEAHQQESVFEADPLEVYDAFFEGEDEADREYLLLNGADAPSDSDDLEEAEVGVLTEDDDDDDAPPETLSSKRPVDGNGERIGSPPRPPATLAASAVRVNASEATANVDIWKAFPTLVEANVGSSSSSAHASPRPAARSEESISLARNPSRSQVAAPWRGRQGKLKTCGGNAHMTKFAQRHRLQTRAFRRVIGFSRRIFGFRRVSAAISCFFRRTSRQLRGRGKHQHIAFGARRNQ
ncbi:hypothetical protein AB1Y20_002267 [Prymnesium parvum]|uniref:J domain-containing protein n=1 Tax=Prymnesium parvum TaxID=97485 RepID=A0AB34JAS9_PRYPA